VPYDSLGKSLHGDGDAASDVEGATLARLGSRQKRNTCVIHMQEILHPFARTVYNRLLFLENSLNKQIKNRIGKATQLPNPVNR